jgi:DNA-binding NarL/FixJ family response regulator
LRRTALTVCPNQATREAIQKALRDRLNVDPVGEAASPAEAIALASRLQPGFTVVAQRLVDAADVLALRAVRAAAPDSKLVVLSWYAGERDWLASLLAGASVLILVQLRMIDTLAETLERVAAGENLVQLERGEQIAGQTAQYTAALSSEGREVISRVFSLETDGQIAAALGMSPDAVREHVAAMARHFLPASALYSA